MIHLKKNLSILIFFIDITDLIDTNEILNMMPPRVPPRLPPFLIIVSNWSNRISGYNEYFEPPVVENNQSEEEEENYIFGERIFRY